MAEQDFMSRFLLNFTKEIIRNTSEYKSQFQIREVETIVKKKEQEQKAIEVKVKEIEKSEQPLPLQEAVKVKTIPEIVKEKMQRDANRMIQMKNAPQNQEVNPFKSFFEQRAKTQQFKPRTIQFMEPKLPPTVSYLKPVPTNLEINLNKLNPLVRDPLVAVIECNGPNENVIVIGSMGRKKTPIILTKEEIDEILRIFSEATKIPIQEGISKIVYGKLILSTIVSEIVGSKFTIKKMSVPVSYK